MEDLEILKCALCNITNKLSEYTKSDIHTIHDNTDEIENHGNMIIRISKLVDAIYNKDKHLINTSDED